jgi:hypothetical protein
MCLHLELETATCYTKLVDTADISIYTLLVGWTTKIMNKLCGLDSVPLRGCWE